jgi:Holliday junction resolvasome RuvABC endonuclease subunit
MNILCLDASSSTIGIAVLEYDENNCSLIHQEYYKPNKKIELLDMLIEIREYILKKIREYKIDEVTIEDYVKSMRGASNAATIQLLALVNMTIRLSVFDKFGIKTSAYNVLKIRHALKLGKKLPKKEEIPSLVSHHLKIAFPWYYKISRKTKEKEVRVESYDVADAIAVGLAHIKIKSIPKKTKVKRTVKKTKSKKASVSKKSKKENL